MNCRDVESSLPLYSGGELSHWRRLQVNHHLGRCNRCNASLAELVSTRSVVSEALKETWLPQNNDSLWERVRSELPAVETLRDGATTAGARHAGRTRAWKLAFVPAAAAAATLILFIVLSRDGSVPPPPVETVTITTGDKLPPVVESIDGRGVKILNFETGTPGVTVAWVFQPDSEDQQEVHE